MARLASFTALGLFLTVAVGVNAAPADFSEAKRLLRQYVYADQNHTERGTFYCGCQWEWVGKSGGKVNQESCGFQTLTMRDRASRIEWEHVMPISAVGQQRQCWRNGGRENCQQTDPVFNMMEADLHNLVPSVGTVNALRSNTNYGMATGPSVPLGACATKVGLVMRVVEPRDEVKGEAARISFYMADRYDIRLSERQQKIFMAWNQQFPVTPWEKERDRRIARAMGHHNPFVTGERHWSLGYKPSGEGTAGAGSQAIVQLQKDRQPVRQAASGVAAGPVYGNKHSGVYHLPQGCPSYEHVNPKNRVEFNSEAEAVASGYRKAGNCS